MSKFAPWKKTNTNPIASSSTVCQKCLKSGHFTFQCKETRPYVSRPSRTQQLENPRVLAKLKADGKPSVEVPEEFKRKGGVANKILEENAKARAKEGSSKDGEPSRKKRKHGSDSESDSDSSSSDSDSDSSSESDSSSASSSSGGSSRSRDRRRRRPRGRSISRESDDRRRSRSRS